MTNKWRYVGYRRRGKPYVVSTDTNGVLTTVQRHKPVSVYIIDNQSSNNGVIEMLLRTTLLSCQMLLAQAQGYPQYKYHAYPMPKYHQPLYHDQGQEGSSYGRLPDEIQEEADREHSLRIEQENRSLEENKWRAPWQRHSPYGADDDE